MASLVDSTVISNFAATDSLALLRDTISPLYLPMEVYQEIASGQREGYAFYDGIEQFITPFHADGWLHLVTMNEDELALLPSLPARLHAGENACLCIARQRRWSILTDDRAARKQARVWGITVSGTLGVLVVAVRDARLTVDEANALLQRMTVVARYRSPVSDINELLNSRG